MTNRFPLIVNSGLNQIQELASGDNLDLTGSNISNVGNITVATTLSTGTLASTTANSVTLNITGTGNVANLVTIKYNETVIAGGSVSGTLTPNVASGTVFNYTLTGSITINTLTNAVGGSGCTLILTQGGSGSYTLTSSMKFLGGTKTLSTAVGAIDIMSVFYDGTTYYASLGKGYA